ncbi:thioredoxin domain-containing protein [Salinicoccus sp. HZC-1]|uniref:thioredoxin domain-containing protein n=1 Tax=Salinicoccus sp. HZC-1 TaxID=3385497 RepID=UPI00398AABBC
MTEEKVKAMHLGDENAPVSVEAFINMACPYCVEFFKAADKVLIPLTDEGMVSYTIKHFDKPKVRLFHGAIANLYLDYSNPAKAYNLMKEMFENQDEWAAADSKFIQTKMMEEFGLEEQRSTMNLSMDIIHETVERGIEVAPTVFINGEQFKYDLNGDAASIEMELIHAVRE